MIMVLVVNYYKWATTRATCWHGQHYEQLELARAIERPLFVKWARCSQLHSADDNMRRTQLQPLGAGPLACCKRASGTGARQSNANQVGVTCPLDWCQPKLGQLTHKCQSTRHSAGAIELEGRPKWPAGSRHERNANCCVCWAPTVCVYHWRAAGRLSLCALANGRC